MKSFACVTLSNDFFFGYTKNTKRTQNLKEYFGLFEQNNWMFSTQKKANKKHCHWKQGKSCQNKIIITFIAANL